MPADSKTDILLDAAAAVYARDRSASMQQIATAAGISRTTLSRRFPMREDLIAALIDRVLLDAADVLDRAKVEDGDIEKAFARLSEDFKALGQVWGVGYGLGFAWSDIVNLFPELAARVYDHHHRLRRFFERGQQSGFFRMDVSAEWLAGAFQGLCETTSDLIADEAMGKRQGAAFLTSIFLKGAERRPT